MTTLYLPFRNSVKPAEGIVKAAGLTLFPAGRFIINKQERDKRNRLSECKRRGAASFDATAPFLRDDIIVAKAPESKYHGMQKEMGGF